MSDEIRIRLLSDTTFSRGDGTAGEVDVEIVHDRFGLPFVPARTIKGLLHEAWLAMAPAFPTCTSVPQEVLGVSADLDPAGTGRLEIHNAELPANLQAWVRWAVERNANPVAPGDILRALTCVRHQTARDRVLGGSPQTGSLRASRTVLRAWDDEGGQRPVTFIAPLRTRGFDEDHWSLLARLCLAVRHVGSVRRRGRGHVRLSLWRKGADCTEKHAHLEVAHVHA
jgi:hypothetical protein